MTLPHDPAAEHLSGGSRRNAHCPAIWPVVTCSAALLAGAVTLVVVHKAGVAFLIIFVSSIAILLLLMAESGHGLLTMAGHHGLAKLRELGSPLGHPALRRTAARIRRPRLIVDGLMLHRRHT
jgi:hypothetical protein